MKQSHIARRKGFTLVELLVVIGIIALLISILIPALGRARRNAQRIKCSANLHDIGIALNNYASENKGHLPENPAGTTAAQNAATPTWPWDMDVWVRNTLVHYGVNRKNFYCPTNDAQNDNTLWNYSVTATVKGQTVAMATNGTGSGTDPLGNSYDSWPFPDEIGFSVTGYVFMIERIEWGGNPPYLDPMFSNDGQFPSARVPKPNAVPGVTDDAIHHWTLQYSIIPHNTPAADGSQQPNDAGKTLIAADAVICNQSTGNYQFGDVIGGWKYPHQSSHWAGGSANYGYPEGGNYLYLDGHAEWHPINKNNVNKTVGGLAQRDIVGNMIFWW